MSRKRLNPDEIEQVRQMLLSGQTSEEVSTTMGVSAATINNFKAHFRKQGDQFPNNRGRRPGTPNKTAKKTTKTLKAKSNIKLLYSPWPSIDIGHERPVNCLFLLPLIFVVNWSVVLT